MAHAIGARFKGCPVSVMSRIAEAFGLLSKRPELTRADQSQVQELRQKIKEATSQREKCAAYLADISKRQRQEADRAVEAIKGVIAKLDNLQEHHEGNGR